MEPDFNELEYSPRKNTAWRIIKITSLVLLGVAFICAVTVGLYAFHQYRSIDIVPEITTIKSDISNVCGMSNLGDVWCWGVGGEVNPNNYEHVLRRPVQIAGIDSAEDIFVFGNLGCAVTQDSTLCWSNHDLDEYKSGNVSSPPFLSTSTPPIVDVDVNGQYSCVVDAQHEMYCGRIDVQDYLQESVIPEDATTQLSDVQQVYGGPFDSCAMRSDHTVWCWSHDPFRRDTPEERLPQEVEGLGQVDTLVGGLDHFCALVEDGYAWCWGSNFYGQLGTDGTRAIVNSDLQLVSLSNISKLAAGTTNTCAITADANLWCWGRNASGQLGVGTTGIEEIPVHIDPESGSERIVVAELLDVTSGKEVLPLPMTLSNVKNVFVNYDLICVILESGSVQCWGKNLTGKVGIGSEEITVTTPTEVFFPGLSTSLTHERKLAVVKEKIWDVITGIFKNKETQPTTFVSSSLLTPQRVIQPKICPSTEVSYPIPETQLQGSSKSMYGTSVRCVATLPSGEPMASGVTEVKDCSNPHHCGRLEYEDKNGEFQIIEEATCSVSANCVGGEWEASGFSW